MKQCSFCNLEKPTLLTAHGRICSTCAAKRLHEQHLAPSIHAPKPGEKPSSAAENFSKVM